MQLDQEKGPLKYPGLFFVCSCANSTASGVEYIFFEGIPRDFGVFQILKTAKPVEDIKSMLLSHLSFTK